MDNKSHKVQVSHEILARMAEDARELNLRAQSLSEDLDMVLECAASDHVTYGRVLAMYRLALSAESYIKQLHVGLRNMRQEGEAE